MENTKPIKPEWNKYYNTLERIRKSGITNMWGAGPYLARFENIEEKLADEILLNWIHNYTELNKQFGWQK